MKHSKLGISSTILAVSIWIYLVILTLLFFKTDYFAKIFNLLFSSNQSGMVAGMGDLGTAILVLLVLFFLIPFIGHLLGIILGLVGTFTRTKKRLFGIIGLFLNVFPFILLFVLYLIGNS